MKKVRSNFVRTLPVMAGYVVLGIGFGIILNSHGFGVLWAFLMSVFIYAGSMQFMAINLIAAGAGMITFALTTLVVNARHLFYGISMIDKYKDVGKSKPYLIFALTDETYSLVCNDSLPVYDNSEETAHKDGARKSNDDRLDKKDYLYISLFDHIYWVTGSVLGALIGELVPFDFKGVDFALTALFVSIVTEQWITNKDHVPALIGLGASVISLLIFGKDNFLIPSMVLITVGLALLKTIRKGGKADERD